MGIINLRIALVNDWLVHVRGQERVFQNLCETFPNADIFTFVFDAQRMPATYSQRHIRTSFVQHLPASGRRFRAYMPLYPLAAKTLNLTGYDLVIASSSAFIHGVSVGAGTVLICYCHSPFRYIWSHWDVLIRSRVGHLSHVALAARSWLRRWDVKAASRVDHYIAPSRLVQRRIAAFYGRGSTIIPPGVDLDVFTPSSKDVEDYFLVVSPLMRWKRVDVAVQAFNELTLPLKIVGDGEESAKLKAMAKSNVEFLGSRTHDETNDLASLYGRCRALILPSKEDFGLAALEAMACGRPVIALRAGGAVETIIEGTTGQFFDDQSAEALVDAVVHTDCDAFDATAIRRTAAEWSVEKFKRMIISEVTRWADTPRPTDAR